MSLLNEGFQNIKVEKLNNRILSRVTIQRPNNPPYECKALWDTGADLSSITQLAFDNINPPMTNNKTNVGGYGGRDKDKETYLIHVTVMPGVEIPLQVFIHPNSKRPDGSLKDEYGIIIGMDIKEHLNFAITSIEKEMQLFLRQLK